MNKKKNINDPLYGFLTLSFDIIFDLIEHPYFQRLRRIRQLGLSHMVFPGANHTRFHHALGALYLMTTAIENLRIKGIDISDEEFEAACIAILLHDIGHGPFSHSLEQTIVEGVHHEDISLAMMHSLNKQWNGKLTMAIAIFTDTYPKKFLHQLVSGQLDMDRLDYLRRDSFYTGVSEGVVSSDRIIKMLYVVDDQLVVEEKGIYSIEKFIIARRLMYWQVYLHKTVVAAENLLMRTLMRAKHLALNGTQLFATPAFHHFLYNRINKEALLHSPGHLELFNQLDDNDVMASIKVWCNHPDKTLSYLSNNLINRHLPKVVVQKEAFSQEQVIQKQQEIMHNFGFDASEIDYLVYSGKLENNAYEKNSAGIMILAKNCELLDIAEASDNYNISALKKSVQKHYLSYPKL